MIGPIAVNPAAVRTGAQVVRFRRDSATIWEYLNPTLGVAEPVIDETNRTLRIGNGVDRYNDLPLATLEDLIDHMTGRRQL